MYIFSRGPALSSCQCLSDLLLQTSDLRHLSEVPEEGEKEGGNTELETKGESETWCLPFWAAAKLSGCLAVPQKMGHLSAKGSSCGLC